MFPGLQTIAVDEPFSREGDPSLSTGIRSARGGRSALIARTSSLGRTKRILALTVLGASPVALVPMAAHAAGDNVTTDTGKLHGATADGVTSFKGIPFAQPPI